MPSYTLGRREEWDPRNAAYPALALVTLAAPVTRIWTCGIVLDQGNLPACVGFSWAHEANAEPDVVLLTPDDAVRIYHRAQELDQWPGEDYDGTSVLAGAKTMHERSLLTEYRWATTAADVALVISQHGPCILGTNWYDDMFEPDANGFIKPGGTLAGGHAILIRGYDATENAFLLHNSWGTGWGLNGCAWIRDTDLQDLLNEGGEVCVPVVRSVVTPEPEPTPPEPPQPEPQGCTPPWLARWLSRFGRV